MLTPKLDFQTALDEGYKIVLQADGVGDVTKPTGESYGVDLCCGERGVCTCPDFTCRGGPYHGACKHMWWISQLTSCDYCGSVMVLIDGIFECVNPSCNAAKSFGLVKEQRAQRRAEQARSAA